MRVKAQEETAKNSGGKNGGSERNATVRATRSLFKEGVDPNPWRLGAKCVRSRLTVSFRSNDKNIQWYKIDFHLFIIKEMVDKGASDHEFRIKKQQKESTLEWHQNLTPESSLKDLVQELLGYTY
jgi:hypothetical protein